MEENEIMEYFGLSGESGGADDGASAQGDGGAGQGAGEVREAPDAGGDAQGAQPGAPGQAGELKAGEGGQGAGSAGDGVPGKVTPNQAAPGQVQPGQNLPNQPAPGQGVTGQQMPGRWAPGQAMPERDAVRRGEAYLDGAIKALGIQDPYTGKLITTKAEYDAYKRRSTEERLENVRRKAGLSEEEWRDLVADLPEVAKAREDSRRLEDMMRRQRESEARARVEGEIAKISAMDPTVKTLADLTAQPNYQEIYGYVKRGYDISDAWRLANFEKLRAASAEASRQAAYNAQAGKAGMVKSRQSGQGNDSVPVPEGVAEIYRGLMPDLSAEDMRADYNRYLKKNK